MSPGRVPHLPRPYGEGGRDWVTDYWTGLRWTPVTNRGTVRGRGRREGGYCTTDNWEEERGGDHY